MLKKIQKIVLGLGTAVFILALAGSIQYFSTEFPTLLDSTTAYQLQAVLGVTATPAPEELTRPAPVATSSALVKVTKIVDGDTIKLGTGQTVRYIGMDTPETKHPTKGVECFGKEASQRNEELVKDRYVVLEKDVSETDRYGRLLRYVWVDGVLINQQLVAEGYAVAKKYPPDIARQPDLKAAEEVARGQALGLWSSCAL